MNTLNIYRRRPCNYEKSDAVQLVMHEGNSCLNRSSGRASKCSGMDRDVQETRAIASKTTRCKIYPFPPILIDKGNVFVTIITNQCLTSCLTTCGTPFNDLTVAFCIYSIFRESRKMAHPNSGPKFLMMQTKLGLLPQAQQEG